MPVLWKSSTSFRETCPYLSFLLNSSKSPFWSYSPKFFFFFQISSFSRRSSTIYWQQDWKCVTSYWLSKYLVILSSSHAEGSQCYKIDSLFPFGMVLVVREIIQDSTSQSCTLLSALFADWTFLFPACTPEFTYSSSLYLAFNDLTSEKVNLKPSNCSPAIPSGPSRFYAL